MTKELIQLMEESKYIVFFTGAGVSTDAGIPDFRSSEYIHPLHGAIPLEYALSKTCLHEHPEVFYDYFWKNLWFDDIKNHQGYDVIKTLSERFNLKAIITQNIDGLHHTCPVDIVELHGNMSTFSCTNKHQYSHAEIAKFTGRVPLCEQCGQLLRPDIILYEESLDFQALGRAQFHIDFADLLIVAGTSLSVYPAASFVHSNEHCKKVLINLEVPDHSPTFDIIIKDRFVTAMGELDKQLKEQ